MADDLDLLADGVLLTRGEVAELLNVSVDTLRKWRELGTGPAITKLGAGKNALVRYSRGDLAVWLRQNRIDSAPTVATERPVVDLGEGVA
jgi:phage terminase Nu1 subunit (DNA packaging protein)